jgi:hypothetical protein
MRTIFTRPKPFLDSPRREWQFDAFEWLLRNAGGYPRFLDVALVLPTAEYFPASGMKGHAGVAALFRRVRDLAGMSEWPCTVEPERAEAPPRSPAAIPVIRYPTGPLEPRALIATFARELARNLVDTFDEPPPGGEALHEPALDVAAVFMGFGLFMANSAFDTAAHSLNEGELVHSLAMYCLLRKAEPASIDGYLNPHLRKYLRLAARDLAQHPLRFARLRATLASVAFEVGDATLPTRSA